MSGLRLVAFDLDGTLIDSSADLAAATNTLIVELGGERLSAAAVTAMVGEGAAVLVRRALVAAGLDAALPGALERFLEIYDACLLDRTTTYEGVVEVLAALQPQTALAVLTNKPSSATTQILHGLGLARYFRRVLGGDTPFGRKPHPAGLTHLMAECGATVDDTLLVGDSSIDLQTARNAGVRICLARYGFGFRFTADAFQGDEIIIDDPRDLLPLVRG